MVRTPPHAPLRPPPRRVTGFIDLVSEDEESDISSPLLRTPKRRRRMPRTSTPTKVLTLPTEPPRIVLDTIEPDIAPPQQGMEEDDYIIVDDPPQEEIEIETTDPEKDSGVGSGEDITAV